MFWVYVLKSEKDGRLYKGLSQNIEKRLLQHNIGANRSKKGFRPWFLVYKKSFETRIEARDYERFLKSGIGREFLKNLI